ncbi:MAG: dipeptidase [Anaerolineaceae bacterium]|nr:dipeptidase [Anaerolineaceae bacterium]
MVTDTRSKSLAYAHQHREQFLEELKALIRIPSVSTDPNHYDDVRETAEWLAQKLRNLGAENATIFSTPLHPVVFAEIKTDPAAPTILIYGHYDVQPDAPVELWNTPPFEPHTREENLFARGATDMKGQIIAGLAAIESIIQSDRLPVNLKFLYEGEEEIGSPSIQAFLEEHKDLLQSDICLNLDAGMIASSIPTITYALRGISYFEIRVKGPAADLHSGLFGGVVHNPAQVLAEVIAGMHDDQGRITLPGFYDNVRPLSEEQRRQLSRMPQNEAYYLAQTGAPALRGEAGYTLIEQNSARPTLDVNGFLSGFTGEGAKTVIPSKAMAKVSMRIVPNQTPESVYQSLKQYLERNMPDTVTWELIRMTGGLPAYCDPEMPATQAMKSALKSVFGTEPVLKQEGASIPIVTEMQQILGIDSVLSGFALPEDNMHAPNEKLHLPTWFKGIDAVIEFFYNFVS